MRYIYLAPVKTAAHKQRVKKLPVLSRAELQKLIKDRTETKTISPASAKRGVERRQLRRARWNKELTDALKRRKTPLREMLELAPKAARASRTHLHKRTGRRFTLLSVESLLEDAYLLKHARENREFAARAFESVHRVLARTAGKLPQAQRTKFSKLADLRGLDAVAISARLQAAADLWRLLVGGLAPTDVDLTQPGPESGEGGKGDQSSASACGNPAPNPKGLILRHRWPLKRHLTSVKDQGNRGTCSAFGTVAAVEAAVSVKYGRKVNLCEQDLYKTQRLDWSPSLTGDYNEDGYFPVLSMLFQMVTGYVFPFERDWEYNPSPQRQPDGDGPWTMSCAGYNGLACSDTNHQATKNTYRVRTTEVKEVVHEVCDFVESIPILGILGGWVCDITTEVIEIVEEIEVTIYETNVPGTSRLKVTGWAPVWDPIWDNDITAAKVLLAANVPLIYCFTVPDSFDDESHVGPNGIGYIVHNAGERAPADAGGHCVAMVGHIDNADIPADWNLQQGAGGGYFILKNSWGPCWADRGFAYAPYAWVNKWGQSIVAITNVERI